MKVSVVIAVYNEEKYIKKCLKSLMDQAFKDFEMIVVDDGSTDNSFQVLLRIKNHESRIKIYKIRHSGPGKARNFGAKKSSGEILVFVDADMYFDKDFINDLIKPITDGKAKGTYSTEEYVANWENCWARCWNYNWNLPDRRRINLKDKYQKKDFRALLKTEFERVKGFDAIGYTDTWTISEKLGYEPEPTHALYYHYNPSSLNEIYRQAKWVGKRKHKGGIAGKIFLILKNIIFISILLGLIKTIKYKEPNFFLFKIVYDFGYLKGLLSSRLY
jgi:glycosyltransferase involved in cell wall biosynthesis